MTTEPSTSETAAARHAGEALRPQPALATPQAAGAPGAAELPDIRKIVVAIHGIGSQRRSDTIRSVARRFGDREHPPLPVMPLGFFSIGKAGEVHVSRLDVDPGNELAKVGFAEVFWADIPRQVVKTEDTLEETKAWGKTVVSRARAAYNARVPEATRRLVDADFELAGGVVEEIVETVAVLETLLVVFGKMGLLKFDLAPLLRDYVGDVQVVTEFKYYRDKIVARFHGTMAAILAKYQAAHPGRVPEIYVVAHSEGTVVSFLGLLQALSGTPVSDPDVGADAPAGSTEWIQCVRGLMTIGSPIDKHIVLWPSLWSGLDLACTSDSGGVTFTDPQGNVRLRLPRPIRWRNYYDFGDPIGFELDTAREFLGQHGCAAFEFTAGHDFGFSRYLLPGKAHNDYWGDGAVFGHFITDVVMPTDKPAPRPQNTPGVGFIGAAIPYLLAAALHLAGVFILFKAVSSYLGIERTTGFAPLGEVTVGVALLALLLFCSTVAARLPRLVKTRAAGRDDAEGFRWHALSIVIFAVGAAATAVWLPADLAAFLGDPLAELVGKGADSAHPLAGKTALLAGAAVIALTGWLAPRKPRWGRRALLVCGVLIVIATILEHIVATKGHGSIWPLVLAGLAFIYLWWLGMLLFDLAFVWHRYIRESVAVHALAEWHRGRDMWPTVTLKKNPRAAPRAQPPAASR